MNSEGHFFGLLLLFCGFLGVTTLHGHVTIMCLDCKETLHPESCKVLKACPEPCKTEVHFLNGHYTFSFGCSGRHGCHDPVALNGPLPPHEPLIGKRHPHEEGQLACSECCNSTGCDKYTCASYRQHTTLPTTTTTTTTPKPTPTTTTGLPIINPTCQDYESETFKCSELAKYNFCTDTSSVAYVIAHEKCAKFCGFCSPYWHVTSTSTTTTAKPTTSVQTIANTPIVAGVSVTQALCADNEVQDFSCADWKTFGFCSDTSGAGYNIAVERCQKTCGFCS